MLDKESIFKKLFGTTFIENEKIHDLVLDGIEIESGSKVHVKNSKLSGKVAFYKYETVEITDTTVNSDSFIVSGVAVENVQIYNSKIKTRYLSLIISSDAGNTVIENCNIETSIFGIEMKNIVIRNSTIRISPDSDADVVAYFDVDNMVIKNCIIEIDNPELKEKLLMRLDSKNVLIIDTSFVTKNQIEIIKKWTTQNGKLFIDPRSYETFSTSFDSTMYRDRTYVLPM